MSRRTFRAAIARLDTPSADGRILVHRPGVRPFRPGTTRVTFGHFDRRPYRYGRVVGEVYYDWVSKSGKLCVAGELHNTEVGNEALTLLTYGFAQLTFDVESYGSTLQPHPADGTGVYHVMREWYVRGLVVGPGGQCWKLAPAEFDVDLRQIHLWTDARWTREELDDARDSARARKIELDAITD